MTNDRPAFAKVPLAWTEPLRLHGPDLDEEVRAPLATFEAPLWPSVNRGARVTARAGGITLTVVDERMSRALLVEAPDAAAAARVAAALAARTDELAAVVADSSRFARFLALHPQALANLLYLRLEIATGDAAGHNMVTLAADRLMSWLLAQYPELRYVSLSGNLCTDKKVSAVNGLLGRGRHVIAEARVPAGLCRRMLRCPPARLVELHVKKNLLGSILAGSVRSANAHYANMLLAFYLATGQDAANIVEGSQGITHAEVTADGDLYFSCSLPNLIVGTVGNGKDLPFVREHLAALGCLAARPPGANARRLAMIAAAVVLCGELSLLAALSQPGELMAVHTKHERQSRAHD